MKKIIDTVRSVVGRRTRITRPEMRTIIAALPIDIVEQSTIGGHDANGLLFVGGRRLDPFDDERAAMAKAWEHMCHGIICISAFDAEDDYPGGVRYDEPGSMHPQQRASVTFAPESLGDMTYIRAHCERLLIVLGESDHAELPTANVPGWVAQLRRAPRVDGVWVRVLDNGTLEMRDPNDGQNQDPKYKARHQYSVDSDGCLVARTLPPESVGDEWVDIGTPEWEPRQTPPRDDLLLGYWEARVL